MLLASQVAIIVEKAMLHEQLVEKKRLEAQLEVARQVQLSLLPTRDPDSKASTSAPTTSRPRRSRATTTTSSSLYDDQLGLVIADVSGKGVPASLLMAFLRASLRAAIHIGYAPHVAMAKVNYLLWESIERTSSSRPSTACSTRRTTRWPTSNAGHNPPLILDAGGGARFIERGGLPLGMFRDARYYEYYLPIEPGQTLVLYTDGVTEAADPKGEEYGRERLVERRARSRDLAARDLIDFIYADVLRLDGRTRRQRRRDLRRHQSPLKQ